MLRKSKKRARQVGLRVQEDLHTALLREAKKSGRSFNQELVWRLGTSFTLLEKFEQQEDAAALVRLAKETLDEAVRLNRKSVKELSEAKSLIAQAKGTSK